MKTLRQIARDGSIRECLNGLAEATMSILPSKDGTEENRCNFIVLFTDDRMQVQYVTDIRRDKLPKLLRELAVIIEEGRDKQR